MREKVDQITRYLLVLFMGVLVIDVVWQVFSRYILQSPSTFTSELARFLLIWVSLLGAAYISGQNGHLAIDILSSRLSPKGRKKLDIMINLIILAFVFLVMVLGGTKLVYLTSTLYQLTPALQIPMALVYSIIPISGLLITYYKLSDIRKIIQSPVKQT